MTFSSQTLPPGSRTAFANEDGLPVGMAEPAPGWLCNNDLTHFEPEEKRK